MMSYFNPPEAEKPAINTVDRDLILRCFLNDILYMSQE